MGNLKEFMRMFQFLKPFKGLVALTLLLTLLVVVFEAVTLWFSGSLLKMIFSGSDVIAQMEKPIISLATVNEVLKYYTWLMLSNGQSSMMDVLKRICLIIPVLFLLKDSLLYVRSVMMSYLNLSVVEKMRNQFYKHILALPMPFYDKNNTGTITSFLIRDLNVVQDTLTQSINLLIMEPFKLVVFFSLLLVINWKLTLIILLTYPLIALVLGRAGKVIKRRSRKMLESFSGIISVSTETISGVRLVKTFHGENYEMKKFGRINKDFTRKAVRAGMISASLSPFNEFVSLTLTSALIWYGGGDVLSQTSSFSSDDFLRFLLILFSAYTPIKKLVNIQGAINTGLSAAERVFEVLELPVEEVEQGNSVTFNKRIECKDITFSYPGYEEVVLKSLNLNIEKGTVVALVGSSGSGKSTILDILPRFYELTAGDVLLDGTSTKDIDLYNLRSLFGVVSQETVLFDDTVAVNIAYGSDEINYDRVEESLRAANAFEFVAKLPEGVQTMVGEQGVTLSGGQRQRLAIARALYKNPEILILDEATSALDTESEKIVQGAIDNLIKNRTSIVVAHRLSTVRNADKIVVLDKGIVVEEGNHEELIAREGRYKELYDIQFSNNA